MGPVHATAFGRFGRLAGAVWRIGLVQRGPAQPVSGLLVVCHSRYRFRAWLGLSGCLHPFCYRRGSCIASHHIRPRPTRPSSVPHRRGRSFVICRRRKSAYFPSYLPRNKPPTRNPHPLTHAHPRTLSVGAARPPGNRWQLSNPLPSLPGPLLALCWCVVSPECAQAAQIAAAHPHTHPSILPLRVALPALFCLLLYPAPRL